MAGIHERLANVETFEAEVQISAAISFGSTTAKIMVTNDSSTEDLTLVLVTGQGITMKPTETLTVPYRADSLTLRGANVPYRVWGFW